MKYEIKSNLMTLSGEPDNKYLEKYKVNSDEELFFRKVYDVIGDGIKLIRMSDGTLSVYYYTHQIGKIKLQGQKHKMQILKGLYGVKWIDGNVMDFIPHIIDWKKYITYLIK